MHVISKYFLLIYIALSNAISMNIIAHRGASGYAPENTIQSILIANDMNAGFIEIDVQLTKDKQVVLMHDKSVWRYI